MKRMYRQGDVLIIEEKIPNTVKQSKDLILVLGEQTGHAHKLAGNGMAYEDGPNQFLQVYKGGGELVHEEHATIKIPEGEYRIIRQREYDEEAIRHVQD